MQAVEVAACRGGPLITDAGDSRGGTLYHIAWALAKTWASIPQVTLASTFVQCKVLTKETVAQALATTPDAVLLGLQDLQQRQKAVLRTLRWSHPDQDFTGNPVQVPDATPAELAQLDRSASFIAY